MPIIHDMASHKLEDGVFLFQHPNVPEYDVECMCAECDAKRKVSCIEPGRLPTYWRELGPKVWQDAPSERA